MFKRRPRIRSAALLAALAAPAVLFTSAMLATVLNTGPTPVPALLDPGQEATIDDLTPTFRWHSASGVTQAEFELIPEGPAASLSTMIVPDPGSFTIPPREAWCCLRRGFSYRWRVRVTDTVFPMLHEDAYWGPWAEGRFTVAGEVEN